MCSSIKDGCYKEQRRYSEWVESSGSYSLVANEPIIMDSGWKSFEAFRLKLDKTMLITRQRNLKINEGEQKTTKWLN